MFASMFHLFVLTVLVNVVGSQSTTSSDCVYVFHVPREENVCPNNAVPSANQEEDGGLTKAQMAAFITNQQQQLALLTQTVNELKQTVLQQNEQNMTSIVNELKLTVLQQTEQIAEMESRHANVTSIGTNYVRWGRTVCPGDASQLYQGYLGKSSLITGYNGGGGANVVCLHNDPQWPEGVTGGFQSYSYMTGGEYENLVVIDGMLNKEIPCISCIVQGRSQQIMIPGRVTCEEGWTLEYSGVLVSQHQGHANSVYECLDENPEEVTGLHESDKSDFEGVFLTVEVKCGFSLPCPPYVDGYEVACVVCTK